MLKRILQTLFLALFMVHSLLAGQASDVKRILSEIKTALGGEQKLAAVKTLTVEGQSTRTTPDGSSMSQDFELAFDLSAPAPKYVRKEVVANLGGNLLSRRSGFNGSEVIEGMDAPPSMGSGIVTRLGPGGLPPNATAEQIAEQKKQQLLTSKREFARLVVALLADSTSAYPVEFVYAGQAEGKDGGKTDVLDVKAADGFTCKLFVDRNTRMPVMISWLDREPLRVSMTAGAGGGAVMSGGGISVQSSGGSAEDMAKMQEDFAARMREAEAKRRSVEYRVFYSEYKTFDGVKLPTRVQRTIDGQPADEQTFDKVKVNGKIDPGKFEIKK